MAVSKSTEFNEEEIQLAKISKALSHPARIRILEILTKLNICMCGDIVELLPLSQSTVSQHLKELKNAGLIRGSLEPPKVCYCVDKDNLNKAVEMLDSFFQTTLKNFEIKRK